MNNDNTILIKIPNAYTWTSNNDDHTGLVLFVTNGDLAETVAYPSEYCTDGIGRIHTAEQALLRKNGADYKSNKRLWRSKDRLESTHDGIIVQLSDDSIYVDERLDEITKHRGITPDCMADVVLRLHLTKTTTLNSKFWGSDTVKSTSTHLELVWLKNCGYCGFVAQRKARKRDDLIANYDNMR